MRAGPMLRVAFLAGLSATGVGCTHRETPPVVAYLSDAGAQAPDAPGDMTQAATESAPETRAETRAPWRLRLTRL